MNILKPPTSTQPQINDSRLYSSKVVPTIRVRLKDSDDGREMASNEKDFDPDRFVRLDWSCLCGARKKHFLGDIEFAEKLYQFAFKHQPGLLASADMANGVEKILTALGAIHSSVVTSDVNSRKQRPAVQNSAFWPIWCPLYPRKRSLG